MKGTKLKKIRGIKTSQILRSVRKKAISKSLQKL